MKAIVFIDPIQSARVVLVPQEHEAFVDAIALRLIMSHEQYTIADVEEYVPPAAPKPKAKSEKGIWAEVLKDLKLSYTQIAALGELSYSPIVVGMEGFTGVAKSTLRSLEGKGLVEVKGTRKTRWTLTPSGKKVVKALLEDGQLVHSGKYTLATGGE